MNNRAGSDIDKDFQTQFCLDKQMFLKKCELLIYTCSFCLKTSKNMDKQVYFTLKCAEILFFV